MKLSDIDKVNNLRFSLRQIEGALRMAEGANTDDFTITVAQVSMPVSRRRFIAFLQDEAESYYAKLTALGVEDDRPVPPTPVR